MDKGRQICELRKRRGWTQQRLAEELHVTDKAVSKWEQGAGVPDIENIVNLAKIFNVTTDYLLMESRPQMENEQNDNSVRYYPIVIASTHAEFLNELLGKQYKQYMKCTYNFDKNNLIWMIRLNEEISSTGWRNTLLYADYIVESYEGAKALRLDSHIGLPVNQRRYVFDILEGDGEEAPIRVYEFRGIFELLLEKSTDDKRIWRRVETKAVINGENYEVIDQKETHKQFVEGFRALGEEFQDFKGFFDDVDD